MRRTLLSLPIALLACLVWGAAAVAADVPKRGALYASGPDTRYLLGGEWLFRLDAENRGLRERLMRNPSRTGWTPAQVPHAWNVGDHSNESMRGTIGWYRKDFTLPSAAAALAWVVRFESVNYRTRVWLNGRPIGENTGAYIPFEMALDDVRRRGVNRLVVRVDSRRLITDFPPSGATEDETPSGGWWNYGGILREVYLRRADTVDWGPVVVRPDLACARCAAGVTARATLRNVTDRPARVRVRGRFGDQALDLGARTIEPGESVTLEDRIRVREPRLWAPGSPSLYRVSLEAEQRGRRLSGFRLESGIRSVKVVGGRLYLNGGPTNLRGVGFHEDNRSQGFAVDNAWREWLVQQARDVGATMMRTHYPPHPYLLELADRAGILIWHEIPVYHNRTEVLKLQWVRELAYEELRKGIEANQNHPSVAVWSVANELSARPGPVQASLLRNSAALAKELDPSRPVAYAVAGYPTAGCQPEYAPIEVLGINEYFGWYPGVGGQLFDRRKLSAYLDQVRACYPDKALLITEFGAEANRDGPIEEKGTWLFQQDFVNFHSAVYATKPWLSGALYWTLNEFRVRPAWEGGNPRPTSPIHQKALITYDGVRKPAFEDVRRLFTQTQQYTPPAAPAGR